MKTEQIVSYVKLLAETISSKVGFSLEDVAEINIIFDIDKTSVYVWYSDFCDKGYDKYFYKENQDFTDSLCAALGLKSFNAHKISLKIKNQDPIIGDIVISMIGTHELLNLCWDEAFK